MDCDGNARIRYGAGWYNEYNANTYLNNNCDSELTSKEALNYINDRVKYFEKNPKYTLKFYAKKMVSQWCEQHSVGFGLISLTKTLLFHRIWIAF